MNIVAKGKDSSTKLDINIKANDVDEKDVTLLGSGKRSANDEEEESSNKRSKFSGLSKEEWTV